MKDRRNLSGIYIRQQNPETGEWENVCFEDCEEETQSTWLNDLNPQALRNLSLRLAEVINEIGEYTDIAKD